MFRGIPNAAAALALTSLIDQLQHHVHLIEIENSTTLELPMSDADFEALHVKHERKYEVREEPPVYLVR